MDLHGLIYTHSDPDHCRHSDATKQASAKRLYSQGFHGYMISTQYLTSILIVVLIKIQLPTLHHLCSD